MSEEGIKHSKMQAARKGPLDGVTIVEICEGVAGSYATWLLARMGATVIKLVEPQGRSMRTSLPEDRSEALSYTAVLLNWGKILASADLHNEEDREKLRRLVPKVDAIVDNFKPGRMEKCELSYEHLSKTNPGIVCVSLKGFGTDSRYAQYSVYDLIMQAMSGVMYATGFPDDPPITLGSMTLMDAISGSHLSDAILGALYGRLANGEGSYVEVSMRDVAVCTPVDLYNMMRVNHGVPAPKRGSSMGGPGAGLFRAKDGYVFTVPVKMKFMLQMLAAMGMPEVLNRDDLRTHQGRMAATAELNGLIEKWMSTRTRAEVFEIFGTAGVPCGPVLDVAEVMADEDLNRRKVFQEVEQRPGHRVKVFSSPIRLGGTTPPPPVPAMGPNDALSLDTLLETTPAQWKTFIPKNE